MAIHSSILDWEVPWTEDTDGQQESDARVRCNLVTKQQLLHSTKYKMILQITCSARECWLSLPDGSQGLP